MVGLKLAVHQQVIDRTSVWIEHHSVQYLAGIEAAYVVCKNVVDVTLGIGSAYKYLAHVGYVKYSHFVTDCQVFLGDTGILDGHVKSSKGTHLGAQSHVTAVQAGFFNFFGHT